MLIRHPEDWELGEAEATPEATYLSRRSVMKGLSASLGAGLLAGCDGGPATGEAVDAPQSRQTDQGLYLAEATERARLEAQINPEHLLPGETVNGYGAITGYNNFYEFGPDKSAPARNAHRLTTDPWSVDVSGMVENPRTYGFDDLVDPNRVEQRVYRFRCVEAWSMIVPWLGVPLKAVLDKVQPLGSAKYVVFQTLLRPAEMIYQDTGLLDWPYQEGLRLDEAAHPLAFLVVGLYGRVLPNQNGAPLRLITPWKYGFKSIKSIVSMHFTDQQPRTTWNDLAPREYGFFANVNPAVPHLRWSQATERRIGELRRRDTLPFNGYAEAVAPLYAGMDLRANY